MAEGDADAGCKADAGALLKSQPLKRDGLLAAQPHNLRHLLPGHPGPQGGDPMRTPLNEVIEGVSRAPVVHEADLIAEAAMAPHGIQPPTRKDAVHAFELLFSAPPGFADAGEYLRACVAWAKARTGAVVISAVIHRDQGHEHCHLLLLPVVAGKWVGSRLLGQYSAMQADFRDKVAARFGLRSEPRLAGSRKAAAVAMVLGWMEQSPARECPSWPAIRASIEANPSPFLAAIGLEAPAAPSKPGRSFTAIMTSKGTATRQDVEQRRVFAPAPSPSRVDKRGDAEPAAAVSVQPAEPATAIALGESTAIALASERLLHRGSTCAAEPATGHATAIALEPPPLPPPPRPAAGRPLVPPKSQPVQARGDGPPSYPPMTPELRAELDLPNRPANPSPAYLQYEAADLWKLRQDVQRKLARRQAQAANPASH